MRLYRFYLNHNFFSKDKSYQKDQLTEYFADNLELLQDWFEGCNIRARRDRRSDSDKEYIKKQENFCIRALLVQKKLCFEQIEKNRLPRLDDISTTVEKNDKKRKKFVNDTNHIIDEVSKIANGAFYL